MKNYRLGNTITVKWTIMTATGTAYNLNASNLELFAVVPNHAIKVDDFSVSGNVVTWTFRGSDQKFTGPYTLTLIENRGQSTMMTVDYCNAFGLVRWSCQAGWDESADVNSSLSLTSEIFTHQIALSKEVQDAIDANITEFNVSSRFPTGGIDGTNRYTLETAIAKIPESLRTVGIKCSFLNEAEVLETWEWQGRSFLYTGNWVQVGSGRLSQIESLVKNGYMFAGIATPDTDPGTPNQKVFYIATEPGTYVKFGEDITITNEIAILYNYVNWRKSSLTDNIALLEYCLTAGINMLPDDRFVDLTKDDDAFTVGVLTITGDINTNLTSYRTSKFIDYNSNYNQPYSLLYVDFGKEQLSRGLANVCFYTKDEHILVKTFDICVGKQMILIPLGYSVRVSINQSIVNVPILKFHNGSTQKDINESIDTLQKGIDTLNKNIDILQENIDTFNENANALQENIDMLQDGSEKTDESTYSNVTLTDENTELDSEHLWNSTNGTQVNGGGRFGTLRYILQDNNRPASVNLSNYIIGVNNGGFLTKEGEWIKGINSSIDTMSDVLIPGDAYYLDISCVVSAPYKDIIFKYTTVKFTLPNLILNKDQIPKSPSPNNQWAGKKLCIIGTSVAYGSLAEKAYAKIAAERLGFEIIPAGVPGQAIHARIDNKHGDILAPLTYGSTCLSKDEYERAKEAGASDITIPETPLPESGKDWEPGSWDYNNYYRTWENIFTKDAGVSLWIFATGPNNGNFELDDWNAFDKINWKYTDGSPFSDHRTTFLGAMLYLMDKMYALGNDQRIVLVLDSAFMYTQTKEAFELLHNQWNIPVIDLWGKINTSPKSLLAIKSKDGTDNHPSTFGQEKLGDIFTNELLLIS